MLADTVPDPSVRSLLDTVFRTSIHLHRDETFASDRRQILALDAARHGLPDLAARINAVPLPGSVVPLATYHGRAARWRVEWATVARLDSRCRRTYTHPPSGVMTGLATTIVDGVPTAVTAAEDDAVYLWNLTTGQRWDSRLTGHSHKVLAMATAAVRGEPVLVTGGRDTTVRIWSLSSATQIGSRVVLWATSADGERHFAPQETFLQFPAAVRGLAIAPGNRLVVAFAHDIATYRLEDATPLPG